jgi:hypothetical protein
MVNILMCHSIPDSPGPTTISFLLAQDPDDLPFCEPAWLHVHPPLEVMDSTHFWRKFRGSGQCLGSSLIHWHKDVSEARAASHSGSTCFDQQLASEDDGIDLATILGFDGMETSGQH